MKHYLYPGVNVRLRVNGVDLVEHDVEDPEAEDEDVNSVTKYVEAAAGTNFAVHFTATPNTARSPDDCVCMRVFLDGKDVTARVYTINGYRARAVGQCVNTVEGAESNTPAGRVLERFAFAELHTTDAPPDAAKQKKEDFKHLGEVTVTCTWGRKVGAEVPMIGQRKHSSAFQSGVPEKCLKGRAISNHATLGAPQLHGAGLMHTVSLHYPYGTAPFAEFNFKYRSRKDLQIEGIIPRSPSPVPLEERDPDELNAEEMRQLLRRMRERQASAVRVKREGERRAKRARSTTVTDGGEDDDDELEITAGPSKRRHTSDGSGVEIVDLTDD